MCETTHRRPLREVPLPPLSPPPHPPTARVCIYRPDAALTLWNQRTPSSGRAVAERRRLGDGAVIFIKAPFSLVSLCLPSPLPALT